MPSATCKSCRAMIPGNARFCPSCGRRRRGRSALVVLSAGLIALATGGWTIQGNQFGCGNVQTDIHNKVDRQPSGVPSAPPPADAPLPGETSNRQMRGQTSERGNTDLFDNSQSGVPRLSHDQPPTIADRTARTFDRSRYLRSTSWTGDNTGLRLAILAVQDGQVNNEIAQAVASGFSRRGVYTNSSVFTDSFVTDGKFGAVFNGQEGTAALELGGKCDYLVFAEVQGRKKVFLDLQGRVSSDLSMSVRIFSTVTGSIVDGYEVRGHGYGWDEAEADKLAATVLRRDCLERSNQSSLILGKVR